jgi:hypothetical protein
MPLLNADCSYDGRLHPKPLLLSLTLSDLSLDSWDTLEDSVWGLEEQEQVSCSKSLPGEIDLGRNATSHPTSTPGRAQQVWG